MSIDTISRGHDTLLEHLERLALLDEPLPVTLRARPEDDDELELDEELDDDIEDDLDDDDLIDDDDEVEDAG